MFEFTGTRLSTPLLVGAAVVVFVGYTIFKSIRLDARIRKLGGRAPIRTSYAPGGIDMAYDVVRHAMEDRTYEMWVQMFNKWCSPGRYTIEAVVGERVILTAEPENIKAILATQFKDYGKGEEFRKDWHAFLGNGMCTNPGSWEIRGHRDRQRSHEEPWTRC